MYVTGSTAQLLLDFLHDRDIHAPDIQAELLTHLENKHIPIVEWYALLAHMERILPGGAVGLDIGERMEARHVGILGHLAVHSDTLLQALVRLSRFQALLQNITPSELSQDGSDMVIRWPVFEPHPQTFVSDVIVAAGTVTLIRKHTGMGHANPTLVEFPHPHPDNEARYRDFFGCPLTFNATDLRIRWPVTIMEAPIVTRNSPLIQALDLRAEQLLTQVQGGDSLLTELRHHIDRCLQDGSPDFGTIAARMGMHERALYRALQARGVRFRTVLNEWRYKLAQDYIRDPSLSMTEISMLLGYTDQSVFTRAFKSWSGMTPIAYRQAQKDARRPIRLASQAD